MYEEGSERTKGSAFLSIKSDSIKGRNFLTRAEHYKTERDVKNHFINHTNISIMVLMSMREKSFH